MNYDLIYTKVIISVILLTTSEVTGPVSFRVPSVTPGKDHRPTFGHVYAFCFSV